MRFAIALAGLLLLTATSLQAQIAAPTINPTLDNLGANPAAVPWSNTRIGLAYASTSTESQFGAPPSTTTSSSQTSLNGRLVGETFAGFINHAGFDFAGTSNSVTEFGVAAQLGGWFGLGISQIQFSAGGNDVTRFGLTAIARDTWYGGFLRSDNGAGTTSDAFGVAYRSEEAHVELIGGDGADTLVAEGFFGGVMAGIVYSFPETNGAVTSKGTTLSVGLVDPADWSFVLNYTMSENDDGAGTFDRSETIEGGVTLGF